MSPLEVLSLNVWGLPWPLSRDRPGRLRRIDRHLSDQDHDVVALQELWRGSTLPRARRGEERRDSGLALAGRYAPTAILEPVTSFIRSASVDRLKGKGILPARIPLGGWGHLRVLITHLQAGHRHGAVRAAQVDQLLELAAAEPGATLLIGDFNLHDQHDTDQRTARRILAEGFTDAAMADDAPMPTWRPELHGQRFDRIYLRSGDGVALDVLATGVGMQGLSDHLPLWARLEARPE